VNLEFGGALFRMMLSFGGVIAVCGFCFRELLLEERQVREGREGGGTTAAEA